jgi:hypothetical protein
MGFRFRRRLSLGPGLRLNFSKSGVSTSVGGRGAWFTFGPKGTRTTVGLPGTGFSYTEQTSAKQKSPARRGSTLAVAVLVLAVILVLAFVSAHAQSTPATPSKPSASQDPGKDPAHRRGICGEIKKLDLLLYDDPSHHEPTTTCSYTDARLLITPRSSLNPDRMRRFTLLAFASVGRLYNDDFALPNEVYAGFGTDCQVMTTSSAAFLNRELRRGDDSGMMHALQMTSGAKRVACPK